MTANLLILNRVTQVISRRTACRALLAGAMIVHCVGGPAIAEAPTIREAILAAADDAEARRAALNASPVSPVAYDAPVAAAPIADAPRPQSEAPSDAKAPQQVAFAPLLPRTRPTQACKCPPTGPYAGCAVCAPQRAGWVLGPGDEYLCDGGDFGSPIGIRADWAVDGLEQEDTAAHYDTLDGRVVVVPSNRVCIYAPRFGVVRRVTNPIASEQRELISAVAEQQRLARAGEAMGPTTALQRDHLVQDIAKRPPSLLLNRDSPARVEMRVAVVEVMSMIRPYNNLQVVRLGMMDNAEKPWLANATVNAYNLTGVQAAEVTLDARSAQVMLNSQGVGIVYGLDEPEKPRLRLIKLASTGAAKPGEEVEFTLRYDNIGGQDIGNVTIVDNLSTRFAYVPDSAQASVEADFSTSENAAGSLILRWEIKEPVKPGEGGVLQFRTKVL